ncbi:MAG: cation transporter [Microthrixaceae bacterium]|nr:cation transporter [Microthrixaceae bacterium]
MFPCDSCSIVRRLATAPSRAVFADFGVSKSLPAYGTATLEFTPDRTGEFTFTCGMNMVHGTLIVEPAEQVAASDEADRSAQVAVGESMAGDHVFAEAVGVGPAQSHTIDTQRAEFRIAGDGVSCASCVSNIESILDRLPGVDRVDANFASERATVEFDPERH